MKKEKFPVIAMSAKVLEEVWRNEPEGLWESYLKEKDKPKKVKHYKKSFA